MPCRKQHRIGLIEAALILDVFEIGLGAKPFAIAQRAPFLRTPFSSP
jgi:hypothetical protein